MSKPIILSHQAWDKLKAQLHLDYPRSVVMISYKMKEVLGFSVREYVDWDSKINRYVNDIRLDFYNESKRTMFLLKYSDYLQGSSKHEI